MSAQPKAIATLMSLRSMFHSMRDNAKRHAQLVSGEFAKEAAEFRIAYCDERLDAIDMAIEALATMPKRRLHKLLNR